MPSTGTHNGRVQSVSLSTDEVDVIAAVAAVAHDVEALDVFIYWDFTGDPRNWLPLYANVGITTSAGETAVLAAYERHGGSVVGGLEVRDLEDWSEHEDWEEFEDSSGLTLWHAQVVWGHES